MDRKDIQQRMHAAHRLLLEETTTREKLESIRALVKGINPRIDTTLDRLSKELSDYEKLHKGELIELSAEHLPERTEEEKKRKRALLLLARSWKQLRSEVERVQAEFEKAENQSSGDQASSWGRILAGAKGPLGIITIAAVIIVGGLIFFKNNSGSKTVESTGEDSPGATVEVIEFQGKQILLSELALRNGPDCDSPHYHAKDNISVKSLDGTTLPDPGSCAFGKAKDVVIVKVEQD